MESAIRPIHRPGEITMTVTEEVRVLVTDLGQDGKEFAMNG